MIAVSKRLQLQLIAFGYACVLLYGVCAWYVRDLAALRDPAYSSGGMWAFGDTLLDMFLFLLALAPTFFLMRLMAGEEAIFGVYSKVAVAATITAPFCVAMLATMAIHPLPQWLQGLFVDRLWYSPAVLAILGLSRVLGRRHRLKRLLTCALAIESATLVGSLAVFILLAKAHQ